MYMEYLKIICLCMLFSAVANGISESRLLDTLLRNYDKVVKPDGIVHVSHSLTLTNILNYDKNIITANAWVFQSWVDSRLSWNGTGGPERLTVPAKLLWKPDILLYNNVGPDSGMVYDDLNVMIRADGSVTYVPVLRLTSQCVENGFVSKSISCQWKFGSWAYSGLDIDFNADSELTLHDYVPNENFDILETNVNKTSAYYSCDPEPYPAITYLIRLRKSFL